MLSLNSEVNSILASRNELNRITEQIALAKRTNNPQLVDDCCHRLEKLKREFDQLTSPENIPIQEPQPALYQPEKGHFEAEQSLEGLMCELEEKKGALMKLLVNLDNLKQSHAVAQPKIRSENQELAEDAFSDQKEISRFMSKQFDNQNFDEIDRAAQRLKELHKTQDLLKKSLAANEWHQKNRVNNFHNHSKEEINVPTWKEDLVDMYGKPQESADLSWEELKQKSMKGEERMWTEFSQSKMGCNEPKYSSQTSRNECTNMDNVTRFSKTFKPYNYLYNDSTRYSFQERLPDYLPEKWKNTHEMSKNHLDSVDDAENMFSIEKQKLQNQLDEQRIQSLNEDVRILELLKRRDNLNEDLNKYNKLLTAKMNEHQSYLSEQESLLSTELQDLEIVQEKLKNEIAEGLSTHALNNVNNLDGMRKKAEQSFHCIMENNVSSIPVDKNVNINQEKNYEVVDEYLPTNFINTITKSTLKSLLSLEELKGRGLDSELTEVIVGIKNQLDQLYAYPAAEQQIRSLNENVPIGEVSHVENSVKVEVAPKSNISHEIMNEVTSLLAEQQDRDHFLKALIRSVRRISTSTEKRIILLRVLERLEVGMENIKEEENHQEIEEDQEMDENEVDISKLVSARVVELNEKNNDIEEGELFVAENETYTEDYVAQKVSSDYEYEQLENFIQNLKTADNGTIIISRDQVDELKELVMNFIGDNFGSMPITSTDFEQTLTKSLEQYVDSPGHCFHLDLLRTINEVMSHALLQCTRPRKESSENNENDTFDPQEGLVCDQNGYEYANESFDSNESEPRTVISPESNMEWKRIMESGSKEAALDMVAEQLASQILESVVSGMSE